jgi:hypothetical protein
VRIVTSAFNLISILGVWGFMAYFGLPQGTPWFLKPIAVVWSVMPFFSLNLVARKDWKGFRARVTLLVAAGLLCSTTLQGLNTMFIIDPRGADSSAMFIVMPFFAYILLGIFLLAAWVFEQKSEDND